MNFSLPVKEEEKKKVCLPAGNWAWKVTLAVTCFLTMFNRENA